RPRVGGRLAQALAEADALILAIPADEPVQDEDFVRVERLLQVVEQERGSRVLVGGVPVLPAVTKCDVLASASDTPAQWQQRVRKQCEDINGRFQKFREQRGVVSAFGQVELLPAVATAAYPPSFSEADSAKAPFGVSELFGESLHQASRYRPS